jgi:hypothetical protein
MKFSNRNPDQSSEFQVAGGVKCCGHSDHLFHPLVLLIPFNKSLFVVIRWLTGYALSSIAYPLIILWMARYAKRCLDVIRVSKILSRALPVFIASLIGGCAGCVDRSIASYMYPLQLEHYNKI